MLISFLLFIHRFFFFLNLTSLYRDLCSTTFKCNLYTSWYYHNSRLSVLSLLVLPKSLIYSLLVIENTSRCHSSHILCKASVLSPQFPVSLFGLFLFFCLFVFVQLHMWVPMERVLKRVIITGRMNQTASVIQSAPTAENTPREGKTKGRGMDSNTEMGEEPCRKDPQRESSTKEPCNICSMDAWTFLLYYHGT